MPELCFINRGNRVSRLDKLDTGSMTDSIEQCCPVPGDKHLLSPFEPRQPVHSSVGRHDVITYSAFNTVTHQNGFLMQAPKSPLSHQTLSRPFLF